MQCTSQSRYMFWVGNCCAPLILRKHILKKLELQNPIPPQFVLHYPDGGEHTDERPGPQPNQLMSTTWIPRAPHWPWNKKWRDESGNLPLYWKILRKVRRLCWLNDAANCVNFNINQFSYGSLQSVAQYSDQHDGLTPSVDEHGQTSKAFSD